MHVLITADAVGGVWTYTRELVCGLLDRGHRITLVSFGRLPSSTQSLWLARKNVTFHPTVFPLEWMKDAESGVAESARYLARIIDESRPDVLHFSQFCYGALECGIPKVVVAHSDVASWWNAVHGTAPPVSSWMQWYTQLVSRGLQCADAVVAPSQWMLDALRCHYQIPSRSSVIYNGRSRFLFDSSTRKRQCVLSVGRVWDEAKQIALLMARKQKCAVRIAGSVEHPERSVSQIPIAADCDAVSFCGEQDESQLRTLYADSATYAATSCYEPFGLAPLEAALSRCALIANDIPVFRELWGNSAHFFRRNDPDSLADAIRLLTENASLRSDFADQAFERARSMFAGPRMVTEYEDLYRKLTGKGASA